MSKTVTFTPAALKAVIAEAVALALAAKKADNAPAAKAAKADQSMLNSIAAVKAFKAKGFGNVTPKEDVKTYRRWLADGYRVIEGSKSVKVRGMNLFHKSQVRLLTLEEKQAMQAQSDAAVARHDASQQKPDLNLVQ